VKGGSYLSLFDGFVDLWETSARLAEVGELALQILRHASRGLLPIPRLAMVLCRTHVSFLLDVSPHQLVLEPVDLLLQLNRLFGFLEPIFCGLGGTEQIREHLALLVQDLCCLPNIGNADFILVRELTELRSLEEELK
jgi:hypothetical protein